MEPGCPTPLRLLPIQSPHPPCPQGSLTAPGDAEGLWGELWLGEGRGYGRPQGRPHCPRIQWSASRRRHIPLAQGVVTPGALSSLSLSMPCCRASAGPGSHPAPPTRHVGGVCSVVRDARGGGLRSAPPQGHSHSAIPPSGGARGGGERSDGCSVSLLSPDGSVEKAEVHRGATALSPVGSGRAQRTLWQPSAGPHAGAKCRAVMGGFRGRFRIRLLQ